MNVAFVVDRFPALSESFVLDQMTGLIDRGIEVDVFARHESTGEPTHPDVDEYGLRARTTYFGPPTGWPRRTAGALAIASRHLTSSPVALLRALNPVATGRDALSLRTLYMMDGFAAADPSTYDVIHCHFGPNGVAGCALRDLLALPAKLVTSFYGYDVSHRRWRRRDGRYRRLFRKGDLFIAISDDMRARLADLGCPADRIALLPLGIDLRRFEVPQRGSGDGDRTVVATVARLIEKKGLEYSIRAIAKLRDRNRQVLYKIIGDGPLRPQLQDLIEELGVGDAVQLLGWADPAGVRELLEQADIFVLPSVTAADGDQEGTPTVLLEAQAMGLPVVSTLHAGIPEIVDDGRSGYLVRERDAEALAERLADLIGDRELRAELGRAGRANVEARHDARALAAQLEEIYRRLVTTNAGSD